METFTITKEHIDQHGRYIGPDSKFEGHVVIEAGLGCVWFERLYAKGSIIAEAGSGIKVDRSITVRGDFTVGDSVTSGGGIWVGDGFTTGGDITAAFYISAKTISSGRHITAGGGIWVDDGLTVVGRVTAGEGASVGDGTEGGGTKA